MTAPEPTSWGGVAPPQRYTTTKPRLERALGEGGGGVRPCGWSKFF
jgi:hypothetical protein